MSKKNILVVSQYYYPEQFRINDICETWVSKGYDVTVLTGIPNYPAGEFFEGYGYRKKRREVYRGVHVIRIPIIPRGNNSFMLSLNYISFVISGCIWSWLNKRKFDLIYIYEISPMTQALPAISLAKNLKVPCFIYVMDLWPENFEIITGIHQKSIINLLDKMSRYIYENCEKIFTASKSFKENISQKGINEEKIIYWPQYAEDFYHPVDESNLSIIQNNVINITFTGNVGLGQGLDILPEVGRRIKQERLNVKFNIVGSGRYKEKLTELIKNERLDSWFHFFDSVSAEKIPSLLSASDFSLICLKKDPIFEMTIPAKLQSSMACGKPILLSASGEVQDIIKESKSGFFSDSGDAEGLFQNLKKISKMTIREQNEMGENSLKYYKNNFNKKLLMKQMDKYISEVTEDVQK